MFGHQLHMQSSKLQNLLPNSWIITLVTKLKTKVSIKNIMNSKTGESENKELMNKFRTIDNKLMNLCWKYLL